ncbi:DUF29 domain-containing protein [Kovacikia minuta CCNUW1]|uniref:DUF29 domain-containing protein n=1 Tax=Kovacikia minuta TaxID=2931930 RepID=UPI001CCA0497|nr:DUF29 domain-containing protein [Kovacikia minuta]UBF28569.1 DUF29 domain-containing protein [Kovacikia minuta CCNUW1]
MTTELQANQKRLYETDYLKWIETTVEYLRTHNYSEVDWENLIEEIEDMGRSERRSLKSNLIVLLVHLLKWQYQPESRSGSWKSSIVEHRRRIREALEESPSLKPYFETVFSDCYLNAVEQTIAETGLPIETFPAECPYVIAEVLNTNFLV